MLWSVTLDSPRAQHHLLPWQQPRNASRAPQIAVLSCSEQGASWTAFDAHSGVAVDGGSLAGGILQVGLSLHLHCTPPASLNEGLCAPRCCHPR